MSTEMASERGRAILFVDDGLAVTFDPETVATHQANYGITLSAPFTEMKIYLNPQSSIRLGDKSVNLWDAWNRHANHQHELDERLVDHCNQCGKYFEKRDPKKPLVSCCVNHYGECCHYGQKEVKIEDA